MYCCVKNGISGRFIKLLFNNKISGQRYHTSISSFTNVKPTPKPQKTKTQLLRDLLSTSTILITPCCYDAITAKLIEKHNFPLTFMSGFAVSAARGYPDTGLLSYAEMLDSARIVCEALKVIPCIADGDTGYGNAVNVKRTVRGYSRVGMAGIMIEDQVSPKRCGHTKGKSVVPREEAMSRIKAAVDARQEGEDIVIMARTDARATLGLDEAIARCQAFRDCGADITFLEAPENISEMEKYCQQVEGPKFANMVEFGKTPILPPEQLRNIGYSIVAYPITLLSASMKVMRETLKLLKNGNSPNMENLLTFEEVKEIVGFNEYYKEEERYKV